MKEILEVLIDFFPKVLSEIIINYNCYQKLRDEINNMEKELSNKIKYYILDYEISKELKLYYISED